MSVHIAGDLASFHVYLSLFAGAHDPTVLDPQDNSTDYLDFPGIAQKNKPFPEPYRKCELLSSECNSSRLVLRNL